MKKLFAAVAFALAAAAPSSALAADNVGTPFSGWIWGNPQPQGSTLHDVAFASGTGYAAGDFGTLLKTANGGLTWQALSAGAPAPLTRVRALDANVLVAGGRCVLRRSDDGGVSFAALRVTSSETGCKVPIASFSFATPTTGYVLLSNGAIVRTDDGGATFGARTPLPGTAAAGGSPAAPPRDVWAVSTETLLAVAGSSVYRSTDGGATWSTAFSGTQGLNGIYFATPAIGYAAGDAKTLLRTADGGVTWTPADVPTDLPAADLTSVRCAPDHPLLCLAATRQGDQLLRTADGGATVASVAPYAGRKILAAAFGSAGSAAAVGEDGASAVSGDAGQNWAPVGASFAPSLHRLRAEPGGDVYAAGSDGALARTTDGGADWAKLAVPTTESLVDVSFPTASLGFALDSARTVFSTSDGGAHWSPLAAAAPAGTRTLVARDATHLLALGSYGIARAGDGQFTVEGGEESQRPSLLGFDRAGAGLVLYGARALIAADADAVKLTSLVRPGGPKARIRAVDFVSAARGFVLDRDGTLWLTRNGGRKWSEIRTTGTALAYDMAWSDASHGFLVVASLGSAARSGYVLRTDDGGHTWRPQRVAAQPLRTGGIVATAAQAAIALADGNQILYTGSGGDRGAPSTLTIAPSATRIARPARVVVRGQIQPAVAGARVQLALRSLYGGGWRVLTSKPTGASGRFAMTVRVSTSSVLVARWFGDSDLAGDGSNVVAIRRGL